MKLSEYEKLVDEALKKDIAIIHFDMPLFNHFDKGFIEILYKDGTTIPKLTEISLDDTYIIKSFEYVTKSIRIRPWATIEQIIDMIIYKKIKEENTTA